MNRSEIKTRMQLSQNLGFMDRQLRAVIGALMIITPMLMVPGTIGVWSLLILASIPVIATAITGWDPLYAIFEKSTYAPYDEDIQQRNWSYANMGIMDRGIRAGVALTLLYALMTMGSMTAEMVVSFLAIPMIMTAITAWDPIYAALGINSFGSRTDVEAAEPEATEQTLAAYYEFPQPRNVGKVYPQAA